MNGKQDEIREQQADKRDQVKADGAFMDDAQRDDAPQHQQKRRKPKHRGQREVDTRIEQIELRPRRLIDGKERVDEHQQEDRRQQERIEGGLHRKQVHHQQEDHRTQRVYLADKLIGCQDRVEENRLKSHQQHGENQHKGWPKVEEIGQQIVKRRYGATQRWVNVSSDERGNPQRDEQQRDGDVLGEVAISEEFYHNRLLRYARNDVRQGLNRCHGGGFRLRI